MRLKDFANPAKGSYRNVLVQWHSTTIVADYIGLCSAARNAVVGAAARVRGGPGPELPEDDLQRLDSGTADLVGADL
jgi:hypothetical protein